MPPPARRVAEAARQARLPAPLLSQIETRLSGAPVKPVAQPRIGRAAPAEIKALLSDYQAGRMAAAERRAGAILSAAPDCALAADVLGNAQMAQGRQAPALAAFQRVVALEPGWPDGHLHLAQALLALGRAAEALDPLAARRR